jgi:pimeloyl-ACP methyl ester carboxylesterase
MRASSDKTIWIQKENQVFCINSDMKVTLYDDFPSVSLRSIVYLQELAVLAFIIQDDAGSKIFFENSILPTFSFPEIFSDPELFFESKWGVIFSIGRSMIQYDIQREKLSVFQKSSSIKFYWKSFELRLTYQVTKTEIIVADVNPRISEVQGDIWKVVNTGDAIYFFSDSINTLVSVHKVDADGSLEQIYYDKASHNHQVELKQYHNVNKSCPILILYPKGIEISHDMTAIFFIHGGPHQKAGNLWDPLLTTFLENGYSVYIPQYKGTIGVDEEEAPSYGIDDFEDLPHHYKEIKLLHRKVIVIGHSYGAFLALKLFYQENVDILVGINGVYDLLTISDLNPKTYAHLDTEAKIRRSPSYFSDFLCKNSEWHHIQFANDPLIRDFDLETSLNRIRGERPKIHYFDFWGHGIFNEFQSSKIVEKIKLIEYEFYKNPSCEKDYERLYC